MSSNDGDVKHHPPLPGVEEVKLEITRIYSEHEFDESFSKLSLESEREYVHIKGLESHYRHKAIWSYFLLLLMIGMVLFQSVLLGLVGAGIWSFDKYAWLLPTLLVQNLGQIVGLAVFVVKALFKELN